MKDLRAKTIRAGLLNIAGRGLMLILRVASIAILGRLLSPADYGLVGMVIAFTGVLNTLGSFGLFQAAIQRDHLTDEQASTMFWVNILLGALLTLGAAAAAPAVAAFYHEPRLVAIMCVVALGTVIAAAGVQHGAHLQRQMRFGASALIGIVSLLISTSLSIAMALAGWGYWAVASTSVSFPIASTIGLWLATKWVPGLPRRRTGIGSMLHFGGTMTLASLISAVGDNFDKLLLGRYWGAEALGLYGRSYHLVWFTCENLNSTIGEVAFAALSRTKSDPDRLKRYFLKGYSFVGALSLPLAAACALFADDMIAVALGPQWGAAADIFRVMAPAMIIVFAISYPLNWLISSLGLVKRTLHISLLAAPLMIAAYAIGLPYGPKGVAIGYAVVVLLKVLPIAAWMLKGTGIRLSEALAALRRPLAATLFAAGVAYAAHVLYAPMLPLVPRLLADLAVFGAAYLTMIVLVTGPDVLYLELLRAAKATPT